MTRPSHNDDPELRALLDSIGLKSTADLAPDDTARQRADLDLRRILSTGAHHPTKRRSWRIGLLGVTAAALCALLVATVNLGYSRAPETKPIAQPAMLRFTPPPPPERAQSVAQGSLSATVIDRLSFIASTQTANHLRVQEVRTLVWDGRGAPLPSTTYVAEGRRYGTGSAPGIKDPAGFPPTRPALLHRLLTSTACTPPRTACALAALVDAFTHYAVQPETARALWHAVAQLDNITDLGTTHDRLGRPAVALSTSLGDNRQLILLADPQTGSLLGAETVDGLKTASARVVSYVVIRSSTRIQTLPTR